MVRQRWRWAAITLTDAGVLAVAAGPASAALTRPGTLRHADADHLAGSLAALGLCAAALWLGVGLLAGALALAPGAAGRVAAGVHRRLVPAVLRRLIAGGAGLGVLLAPVAAGAGPAVAHTPTSHPAVARARAGTAADAAAARSPSPAPVPPPLWPTSDDGGETSDPTPTPHTTTPGTTKPGTTTPPRTTRTPTHTTPAPTTPAPTTSARTSSTPSAGTATVQPGDSLWLIAARRLGADATDAQIADYWPQVYAANRRVVGADPDLVRPGQQLRLPAPSD